MSETPLTDPVPEGDDSVNNPDDVEPTTDADVTDVPTEDNESDE